MEQRDWWPACAEFFVRYALAVSYLSAVADRFGLWGPPGAAGVAWGAWQPFMHYVGILNWYAPAWALPALGWGATIAEVIIALGLMVGWRMCLFAWASGVMLMIFALTMTMANGVKPPLDYSVLTAAAASFLLATHCSRSTTFASMSPKQLDKMCK